MKRILFFAFVALLWAGCEAEQNAVPSSAGSRSDLELSRRVGALGMDDYEGTLSATLGDSLYRYDTIDTYDMSTLMTTYEVVKVNIEEEDGPGGGTSERKTVKGELLEKTINNDFGHNYKCKKDDSQICYESGGVVTDSGVRPQT